MEALIADRLPIFWRMMGAVGLVMALLAYRYLRLLGQGYTWRAGEAGGVRGVLATIRQGPAVGWRRWLRHLWRDGLQHPRLYRADRIRWGAHLAVLGGFSA